MLYPQALWYFLLLIPVISISVWRFIKGWQIYHQLGGSSSLIGVFTLRHFSRDFFLVLAFGFIILAMTDIYAGNKAVRQAHSGLEIVFTIDISQSMLTKDAPEERLQVAKTLAQELLFSLKDPHVALVIFKGEAFTALPLTTDREMVAELLSELDTSWLSHAGTNIADALKESRMLFSNDNQSERIIILFSDGEMTKGDLKSELRKLFHDNIKVYSIGIGSVAGADVPDAQGSPRMNSQGELLRSYLNPALLKNIAATSNGAYFWAGDAQILDQLKKIVKQNENKNFRIINEPRSLFNFFILMAILSLSLSLIIRSWSWKSLFGSREY